jgi:hypothetical protein
MLVFVLSSCDIIRTTVKGVTTELAVKAVSWDKYRVDKELDDFRQAECDIAELPVYRHNAGVSKALYEGDEHAIEREIKRLYEKTNLLGDIIPLGDKDSWKKLLYAVGYLESIVSLTQRKLGIKHPENRYTYYDAEKSYSVVSHSLSLEALMCSVSAEFPLLKSWKMALQRMQDISEHPRTQQSTKTPEIVPPTPDGTLLAEWGIVADKHTGKFDKSDVGLQSHVRVARPLSL